MQDTIGEEQRCPPWQSCRQGHGLLDPQVWWKGPVCLCQGVTRHSHTCTVLPMCAATSCQLPLTNAILQGLMLLTPTLSLTDGEANLLEMSNALQSLEGSSIGGVSTPRSKERARESPRETSDQPL